MKLLPRESKRLTSAFARQEARHCFHHVSNLEVVASTGACGRRPPHQAACATLSERTRPPMSTISATLPSPRMVAPEIPAILR